MTATLNPSFNPRVIAAILLVVAIVFAANKLRAEESGDGTFEPTMLIRVQRAAIEPPDRYIATRSPVDRVILGTRAIGTSDSRGTMRVMLDERYLEPTLYIDLTGASTSRTVGRNGPATIHSTANTQFRAIRHVRFTLEHGFVASPSRVGTTTQLNVNGISASQPGLRGRIIQRVATRRAGETHSQAQAIVDGMARAEIHREFESSVDAYLAELNQQFANTRQLARLAGPDSKLHMRPIGEDRQCVALYLAPKDAGANVRLPELDAPQAVAEVWMKRPPLPTTPLLPEGVSSLLASRVPAIAGAVAAGPLLKLPILSDADASSVKYRTVGDWTVISMGDESALANGGGLLQRLAATDDATQGR